MNWMNLIYTKRGNRIILSKIKFTFYLLVAAVLTAFWFKDVEHRKRIETLEVQCSYLEYRDSLYKECILTIFSTLDSVVVELIESKQKDMKRIEL